MSKAFTKESDDVLDVVETLPRASVLPCGKKNLITPEGFRRLRAELEASVEEKRPRILALTNEEVRRGLLQMIDRRCLEIQENLQSAEIVPPPADPVDDVRFGAAVKVRGQTGEEMRYRIVGIDETDFDEDAVSWVSPIAQALLGAQVGQRVPFTFPSGEENLEVLEVKYE